MEKEWDNDFESMNVKELQNELDFEEEYGNSNYSVNKIKSLKETIRTKKIDKILAP